MKQEEYDRIQKECEQFRKDFYHCYVPSIKEAKEHHWDTCLSNPRVLRMAMYLCGKDDEGKWYASFDKNNKFEQEKLEAIRWFMIPKLDELKKALK